MNIAVLHAFEFNHRGTLLIIIEEVHRIAFPGQMRQQFAMQYAVRRFYGAICPGHILLRALAIVVIEELHYILRLRSKQSRFFNTAVFDFFYTPFMVIFSSIYICMYVFSIYMLPRLAVTLR